jgi:hypothetical protein
MSGFNPLPHIKDDMWNYVIMVCVLLLLVCLMMLFVPGAGHPIRTPLLLITVTVLNGAMFLRDRNTKE